MNEKKNIDKLFKEQFKDFDVAPKDHVWENIEERLHEDKRKRRIIPIWWKVAGIAAGLVLLFAVANQVFNTTNTNTVSKDIIVDDTNSENDKSQDETNVLEQHDASKIILENDTEEQIVDTNSKSSAEEEESSTNKNNVIKSNDQVHSVIVSDNSDNKNLKDKNQNNSPSTTNDYKKLLEEKKRPNQKPSTKNAIVSSTKAPTKTNQNNKNSVKEKSEIDEMLKSNSTETSTKNAVASTTKTSTKTNQIDQNKLKDKSEIDALMESTKTENKTSVADANTKDKNALEKENSEVENKSILDTQNKEEEKEKEANAIENAIAEAEDTDEKEEEEEKLNRWSVSPSVAPVYFSSLGEGSPLDSQFIENTKEQEINMSYGVNGSYAVNKKLKIRAGINKVQLGYKTNEILIFENTNPVAHGRRQIANVNLVDSMSKHSIYSARNFKFDNAPATLFTQERGALDQQLGFVEVPIELEYNIIENKIGLNLIGGFSALFLSENDVYAVLNNGERTRLGEATNIKDLSYTANFGIGVDYNFSKQLQFNLDPTFKYQINTFNNTSGDFKPFFIGLYTGLSFKF
ncbi:hypothetical protein [Psychroserpens ponticola]|uniref:Outer membrane protein beta-barrel domain-containing protein n=1 Tax=Psychroserpens ponticola TaxID=2932268 RepID=A0ABY7RWS6_9FLAO|nr:hypothetical protein [Psychroserpens ponticola]WCO01601.1 hypothetical protein MUN68_016250 [Psychroserpens ponticola]